MMTSVSVHYKGVAVTMPVIDGNPKDPDLHLKTVGKLFDLIDAQLATNKPSATATDDVSQGEIEGVFNPNVK